MKNSTILIIGITIQALIFLFMVCYVHYKVWSQITELSDKLSNDYDQIERLIFSERQEVSK